MQVVFIFCLTQIQQEKLNNFFQCMNKYGWLIWSERSRWWASKWQENPNRLSPMTLNFFIMYLALLLFIYHRCYSLIESLKVIIVASALPMTCQTPRAPYARLHAETSVSGYFSNSKSSSHDFPHTMLAKRHFWRVLAFSQLRRPINN